MNPAPDAQAHIWLARSFDALVPAMHDLGLKAAPGTAKPPTDRQMARAADTLSRAAVCLRFMAGPV